MSQVFSCFAVAKGRKGREQAFAITGIIGALLPQEEPFRNLVARKCA
jgi:hypothetical protein